MICFSRFKSRLPQPTTRMASTSQTTKTSHEKLWSLLINNTPNEVKAMIRIQLPYDEEDWETARQENWQKLFKLKMEVLAKTLHGIEHTVAMLESPQLSADIRALILKPNVNPRTFREKAFKTMMTDLFLRSFHVSERGAGGLWSATAEGNNYYIEDASRVLRDRWVGGEVPNMQTVVQRFCIMRRLRPLTNYGNRENYLQDVSLALWFAKKIFSYYDSDYSTKDFHMLRLSIYNLERLIRMEYASNQSWQYQRDMAAMERFHNIMVQCRTHRDVENARFRYTDKNGNQRENAVNHWRDCRLPDEKTCDSEADEESGSD